MTWECLKWDPKRNDRIVAFQQRKTKQSTVPCLILEDHFGVDKKKSGDHFGVNLEIISGLGIISGAVQFYNIIPS